MQYNSKFFVQTGSKMKIDYIKRSKVNHSISFVAIGILLKYDVMVLSISTGLILECTEPFALELSLSDHTEIKI